MTVADTREGVGNTSTAVLSVVALPTLAKAFSPEVIQVGGTSTLTFKITNPNAATVLTNVAFSDTFPANITAASPTGLAITCIAGTIVIGATSASGAIGVTIPSLAGGASCTLTLNVTGSVPETAVNTTMAITSDQATGNPASATLVVVSPPTISKAFAHSQIQLLGPGNSTALTFTVTNPAGNPVSLSGISFNDTLPAGLVVATPNGVTGSCGAGTITAVAGSNSISLAGATLAAGASCTFSVNVSANALGVFTNTTSAGLQIPMDHAMLMRILQGFRDLFGIIRSRVDRQRAKERLALNQLHDQRVFFELVDGCDIR